MNKEKKLKKDILVFRNCPLCGNKNSKIRYKRNYKLTQIKEDLFSARRERKEKNYEHNTFMVCKTCNLVYANPIIKSKIIERLYKKSKFSYSDEEENLMKTYGNCLKRAEKYVKKGKILDIGTGDGFFLKEALVQGYENIYGVEPSKHAIDLADKKIKKKIKRSILKKGQFKDKFFDVICFFHVIDHVAEPNKFLGICYNYLKKGGVIICVSHDVEASSAKIMGERSPIFDIEHTQLFSKKTISKILEKNKFKIVEIFDVTNIYTLKYWLKVSPVPQFIKTKLRKIFHFSGLINKKIAIKPGNFGIIAIKQ